VLPASRETRHERRSLFSPALALQMSATPIIAVSAAHEMMSIEVKLGSEELFGGLGLGFTTLPTPAK